MTPPLPSARELSLDDVRRTAVVGAGTFLAFAPMRTLFTDSDWIIETFGAVLCVLGPAMILRLRRGPNALQLLPGLGLLVVYTTAVYLHGSAFAGLIPEPQTWRALRALNEIAGEQVRTSTAPLPSTIELRVAVVPALAVLAAIVDWAAVVRRAPAMAGVPLLALFTICGATAGTSVGWLPFAVAASGFLVILSADSRVNLLRWGRIVPRRQGDHAARPRLGLSGRRIGVIAVVTAVIVPVAVPGLSRNLLVDAFHPGQGTGGEGTSLSPFATLKGQLNQGTAVSLATVQVTGTNRPYYLRSKVLDLYTGGGWRSSGQQSTLPLEPDVLADARGGTASSTRFTAVVTFDRLDDTSAPLFGAPERVDGLGGNWSWDPVDSTVSGDRTRRGISYTESVLQPDPSVAELRSASRPVFQPDFSGLPGDLPALVRRTVRNITAESGTPYDRARALTNYFLAADSGFAYTLQTKSGDSGSDLVDFLRNKSGYCQQYAGALAVMLRVADIPSRVVLGYTHPAPDKFGRFTITSHDAHAWVEGYFDGLGWIAFDPTPLDSSRVSQLAYAPHPTQAGPSAVPSETGPSASRSTALKPDLRGQSSGAAGAAATGSGGLRLPGWLRTALEGVLILALALLVLPLLRRLRQRSRFRRALGSGRLEPLWEELYATAVDTRAGWGPSTTPRQVPTWLAGLGVGAAAGLTDLARAVERERYAPATVAPASPVDVNDAIDRVVVAVRALRARLRPLARLRATLLPASVIHRTRIGVPVGGSRALPAARPGGLPRAEETVGSRRGP